MSPATVASSVEIDHVASPVYRGDTAAMSTIVALLADGWRHLARDEAEPACACADAAIRQDQSAAAAWYLRGCALARLGHPAEAISSLNAAIERARPVDTMPMRRDLAQVLAAAGDPVAAAGVLLAVVTAPGAAQADRQLFAKLAGRRATVHRTAGAW